MKMNLPNLIDGDKRTKGVQFLLVARKAFVLTLVVGLFAFLAFRYGKTIYFAVRFEKQIMYAANKYEAERSRLLKTAEAEAEMNFKESLTGLGKGK